MFRLVCGLKRGSPVSAFVVNEKLALKCSTIYKVRKIRNKIESIRYRYILASEATLKRSLMLLKKFRQLRALHKVNDARKKGLSCSGLRL